MRHALTTAIAVMTMVSAAWGQDNPYTLQITLLQLGNVPVGVELSFQVPARTTNYTFPPTFPGLAVVSVSQGQFTLNSATNNAVFNGNPSPFTFLIGGVPTASGPRTFRLIFGASHGPFTFPNTQTLIVTYNGTGEGTPASTGFYSKPTRGFTFDPVSTASGELFGFDDTADLDLGGPLPLRLHRFFGSYLRANGVASAVGANWMHNFDVKLAASGSSAAVTVFRGKTVRFTQSSGAWQLATRDPLPYQLVSSANEFRFFDPASRLIYHFNSAGALIRIEDRNGNVLSITPEAGNIGPAQVSDGLGRTLTFTYTSGRLTRVRDQSGRSVSYDQAADNLMAATDANGKRATYAYTTAGGISALMTEETRPAGNRPLTQTYDAQGRVSRQADSRGNSRQIEYPATTGNSNITQPLGVAFTHFHDASQNFTRFVDAVGQALSITYDANGRPTGLTNRLGDRVAGSWHQPSGLPASFTDELGNTATFGYTAQTQGPFTFHNLITVAVADGTSIRLAHDARGNLAELTDHAGMVWRATYNQRGQIETLTNPAGGVATRTYSADGTLASVRTDSGSTTRFNYDSAFRLIEQILPNGATTRFQYDARNRLLRRTDSRGNSTSFAYDDNNNPRSITDSTGATTSFVHDTDDRLAAVTDALGKTTRFTYDAAGRQQSIANAAGNRIALAYDTSNRLTGAADAAGKGPSLTYDREDRLTSVTDPLGRTVRFTRNKVGQVTRLTTPLGENYDVAYDALRRPLSFTNPLARTARTSYDARGLIRSLELPADAATFLERNELGQITRIIDPSGGSWRHDYDREGRMVSSADPLGRTTSFGFSGPRVVRVDLPDNSPANVVTAARRPATRHASLGSVQVTYSGANLSRLQYSDGVDLAFTYDSENRLTGGANLAIGYDRAGRIIASNGLPIERDDAGRVAAVTHAAGKTVRYTYDARGLLTRVADWVGGFTELTWDDARQLTALTRPNGVREEYSYDRNGRLSAIRITRAAAAISSITIRRDAAGLVASVDRTAPPAPDVPNGSLPLAYDAAHQVFGFIYDAMGRVVSDGLRTYSWNLASRLVSYSGAEGRPPSATTCWDKGPPGPAAAPPRTTR